MLEMLKELFPKEWSKIVRLPTWAKVGIVITVALVIATTADSQVNFNLFGTQVNGNQNHLDTNKNNQSNQPAPTPAPSPPSVQRDPDSVYQNGEKMGRVLNSNIILGQGRVTFDHIISNGDFNIGTNFEYRTYTLRCTYNGATSFGAGPLEDTLNHPMQVTYHNVDCIIT